MSCVPPFYSPTAVDSPCPYVRPSVCRRHGFRSVTPVCFTISIPNSICVFFVAMDRSLHIFSDVTFKMAAKQPYWIFQFPDSNFSLALNVKSKLHWHITCVYSKKPIDFHFPNGYLAAILHFFGIWTLYVAWFLGRNSGLLWNFNIKFHVLVIYGYRPKPNDFQRCHFQHGCLVIILDFSVSGL